MLYSIHWQVRPPRGSQYFEWYGPAGGKKRITLIDSSSIPLRFLNALPLKFCKSSICMSHLMGKTGSSCRSRHSMLVEEFRPCFNITPTRRDGQSKNCVNSFQERLWSTGYGDRFTTIYTQTYLIFRGITRYIILQ